MLALGLGLRLEGFRDLESRDRGLQGIQGFGTLNLEIKVQGCVSKILGAF